MTGSSGSSSDGPHRALVERILDDPDIVESGFVPRATERPSPAGPIDLYGTDAEGRAVAIEIKGRRAGPDAASQLGRYVDALERDLHADADVRGILVAPSATDRCLSVLDASGLAFVPLSPDRRG